MNSRPVSARKAAVRLLDQVLGEGRMLSDLLDGSALAGLDPADRARGQRLAVDTLRGLERADRILDSHLRKRPPVHVRNALRLGTVELCMGGDAHGVVNEISGIAGGAKNNRAFKGLANAVLRKVADEDVTRWKDLRTPRMPAWLRTPLVKTYGGGRVSAMEAAHFEGAPLDLTAKGDAAELASRLGGVLLPTVSVRLDDPGRVSALPGYDTGEWWVQDAAAALPVRLLDPKPGERVLDLCAAPGGKTMQLAAAGAEVTALDLSETRMEKIQQNLTRTGLSAQCIVEDALEHQGGGL